MLRLRQIRVRICGEQIRRYGLLLHADRDRAVADERTEIAVEIHAVRFIHGQRAVHHPCGGRKREIVARNGVLEDDRFRHRIRIEQVAAIIGGPDILLLIADHGGRGGIEIAAERHVHKLRRRGKRAEHGMPVRSVAAVRIGAAEDIAIAALLLCQGAVDRRIRHAGCECGQDLRAQILLPGLGRERARRHDIVDLQKHLAGRAGAVGGIIEDGLGIIRVRREIHDEIVAAGGVDLKIAGFRVVSSVDPAVVVPIPVEPDGIDGGAHDRGGGKERFMVIEEAHVFLRKIGDVQPDFFIAVIHSAVIKDPVRAAAVEIDPLHVFQIRLGQKRAVDLRAVNVDS